MKGKPMMPAVPDPAQPRRRIYRDAPTEFGRNTSAAILAKLRGATAKAKDEPTSREPGSDDE